MLVRHLAAPTLDAMDAQRIRTRLRARRAFTLVEVIVAVVLIDVGLLALLAATAVLMRADTDARARLDATRAADARLGRLGAMTCDSSAAGTTSGHARSESWSATLPPGDVRELRDSVSFSMHGSTSFVVLSTRLPC